MQKLHIHFILKFVDIGIAAMCLRGLVSKYKGLKKKIALHFDLFWHSKKNYIRSIMRLLEKIHEQNFNLLEMEG